MDLTKTYLSLDQGMHGYNKRRESLNHVLKIIENKIIRDWLESNVIRDRHQAMFTKCQKKFHRESMVYSFKIRYGKQ